VIGLFFLFAVLVAVVVVPVATIAAVRAVGRAFNVMGSAASRPVDDAVDARLTRIEEAIDAMAMQIDRISRERRALPASDAPRERPAIDPGTREDS
jgi:sensor domain CHASE-containing protein